MTPENGLSYLQIRLQVLIPGFAQFINQHRGITANASPDKYDLQA